MNRRVKVEAMNFQVKRKDKINIIVKDGPLVHEYSSCVSSKQCLSNFWHHLKKLLKRKIVRQSQYPIMIIAIVIVNIIIIITPATTDWASLPNVLQKTMPCKSFKKNLEMFLMEGAFDDENCGTLNFCAFNISSLNCCYYYMLINNDEDNNTKNYNEVCKFNYLLGSCPFDVNI